MVNTIGRKITEIANGVIDEKGRFYPWKSVTVTSTATTMSPSSANQRFYVKSFYLSVRLIAADTTTVVSLSGKINNVTTYFITDVVVPSVASANVFIREKLGYLLDSGTPITYYNDAAPTAGMAVLQVAEVDDI